VFNIMDACDGIADAARPALMKGNGTLRQPSESRDIKPMLSNIATIGKKEGKTSTLECKLTARWTTATGTRQTPELPADNNAADDDDADADSDDNDRAAGDDATFAVAGERMKQVSKNVRDDDA
jgi:hypothetical protein